MPRYAGQDTLRGILVLEGSDPTSIAVVRTSHGRVVLAAPPVAMLKLSQLDLWVTGDTLADRQFKVTSFEVRAANGSPAFDGVLEKDGSDFFVVQVDKSRQKIAGAPARFSTLVGSRVWFTRTSSGSVADYGIIEASNRRP